MMTPQVLNSSLWLSSELAEAWSGELDRPSSDWEHADEDRTWTPSGLHQPPSAWQVPVEVPLVWSLENQELTLMGSFLCSTLMLFDLGGPARHTSDSSVLLVGERCVTVVVTVGTCSLWRDQILSCEQSPQI